MIFIFLSRYLEEHEALTEIFNRELEGLWEGAHTFHFTLTAEECLIRLGELASLGEQVVVISPAYWHGFSFTMLRNFAGSVKGISPRAWFMIFDDQMQHMKSNFLIDGFIASGFRNEIGFRADQLLRFLLVCSMFTELSEVRGRLPWLSVMED